MLLTTSVLVQSVLVEEFTLLVRGLFEELLHGDLAKGKGFPVTSVFRVLVEVVVLQG